MPGSKRLEEINARFVEAEAGRPTVDFTDAGLTVSLVFQLTLETPKPPPELPDEALPDIVALAIIQLMHGIQSWQSSAYTRCLVCWQEMVKTELVDPSGKTLTAFECSGCGWEPKQWRDLGEPVNGKEV